MSSVSKLKCLLVLAVAWPVSVLGHDLSVGEREVWAFIEQCQEAFKTESEKFHDCFHDDFLGWQYPDLVPRTARANREFTQVQFETGDTQVQDVRPVGMRVYGNFAVAHYYVQSIARDQNGQDVERRMRWTDVLLKEDGRWYWISDHGGEIQVVPQ